jgi:formylglycine-generating enzyme
MMLDTSFLFLKTALCFFILNLLLFPAMGFSSVVQETLKGDKKLAEGLIEDAEKHYTIALQMDPDNWRIMRSLAEVQFRLKKYIETKQLVDRILAMKVSKRKIVVVKMKENLESFEAEIVDENVITPDSGANNMRNYVDGKAKKPIPHYRLFNLKTGKMLLIPHDSATIHYQGVPGRDYAYVQELHAKVENLLIAKAGSSDSVEMIALKGGCFNMGSDGAAVSEGPKHEVCLNPFELDKFEVTQATFQAIMGHNPSRFKGAKRPVESVTWHEAEDFCKKSNKRLPTEAEWEYAARGGTNTEFYWGDEFDVTKSNFCDSKCVMNIRTETLSDGFPNTAPVGSFPANPFGLHDMAGNVNEWVSDWFEIRYYKVSPKNNPQGAERSNPSDRRGGGTQKVYRGGAWKTEVNSLRAAWRKGFETDYRLDGTGFRCAR